MSRLLNNALNADPTTEDYKSAWAFLTDDRFAYSLVRERIEDDVDKATRLAARKQARAEYADQIRKMVNENAAVHEGEVVAALICTYWLRFADLCGVTYTSQEAAGMQVAQNQNF